MSDSTSPPRNVAGDGNGGYLPNSAAQYPHSDPNFYSASTNQQSGYYQSASAPYGYPAQQTSVYGYSQGSPAFSERSKVVAGVLGILIGALGIHNFYLGFKSRGLAQLLITVLSLGILSIISGIWGLVEGICILIAKPGDRASFDADGRVLRS
ncbi:TM2 domain-containing protein [Trueperella sp. LYQ143]|uniref:TM2 domain-containing protein n=1 Tax=unclassified Trueperella TaxID=2630174 RepID=UPI00398307D7